jgi:hypothetical protein
MGRRAAEVAAEEQAAGSSSGEAEGPTPSRRLKVNGNETTYPASEVTSFRLDGARGDDSLTLRGDAVDDVLRQAPSFTWLQSSAYQVQAKDLEDITVDAGDGNDTAFLFDSAHSDSLQAAGNATTVSGRDYSYEAIAFETVRARSDSDGEDEADRAATDFALTLLGAWTEL